MIFLLGCVQSLGPGWRDVIQYYEHYQEFLYHCLVVDPVTYWFDG